MDRKREGAYRISRRRKMGLNKTTSVVQILSVVHSAEELRKVKDEFSKRGKEFITHNPNYIYEIDISQEEDHFVITYILRPKNTDELEQQYDDY